MVKSHPFLFFYHYHIRANVYCVAYELCIMSAMSKLKHHATYPNRFAIFARQYIVTLFHTVHGTRIYEGLSRYDYYLLLGLTPCACLVSALRRLPFESPTHRKKDGQRPSFFCRYFSIVGCMSQPPSGLRQPLPIGTYWWFIMSATHLHCLDMKLTPASKFIHTAPHNDGAMTINVYK